MGVVPRQYRRQQQQPVQLTVLVLQQAHQVPQRQQLLLQGLPPSC
jgi:hypothetical protein